MNGIQPDERGWHFKQLRHALQQLAASGSRQTPLFPDLLPTADELALNFDHWATLVVDDYGAELTNIQRASLIAIEDTFARMSRDAAEFDAEVWTPAALQTSVHWVAIRQLALAALDAFGWLEQPAAVEVAGSGSESVP